MRVELALNPAGRPAQDNDITRSVNLGRDLNEEQRAQLRKIANVCPMHPLLTGEVRMATSFTD